MYNLELVFECMGRGVEGTSLWPYMTGKHSSRVGGGGGRWSGRVGLIGVMCVWCTMGAVGWMVYHEWCGIDGTVCVVQCVWCSVCGVVCVV